MRVEDMQQPYSSAAPFGNACCLVEGENAGQCVFQLACAHLSAVMPGLVPGIHVFHAEKRDVDGRDIGERSDAVLRTAMPDHDEQSIQREWKML
jgi:hypothetical protein